MKNDIDYLLSICSDKDSEQIYIHADLEGIERLERAISFVKSKLLKGECDHVHLYSESWGGNELSESMLEQEVEEGRKQVHHVKLYGWNEEWAANHKLKI